MKRVLDEKRKKVFVMKKSGYEVHFTLLDMGSYVGHKDRPWFKKASPYWETMFINIKAENPARSLDCEFLINSDGEFQSLAIADHQGHKRHIIQLPHFNLTQEEYEQLYGKGIHNEGGSFIQEILVDENSGKYNESTQYYFDDSTQKFLDLEGNEAPPCSLTNLNLGKTIRKAARKVKAQFITRNNPEIIEELEDVDF